MAPPFRIAVIPGDGIGKEVMPEGVRVLDAAAKRFKLQLQYQHIEWASCDWYAKTALKQQQENEQRKCGFNGPEWSLDLTAHMNWCRGVAPDMWKKKAQQRDQQLAACAKK